MANRKVYRRRRPSSSKLLSRRLSVAIDAQRRQLFQVSAILAALGGVLHDVSVPGHEVDAPDLAHVADALITQLDRVCTELDPTALQLDDTTAEADEVQS